VIRPGRAMNVQASSAQSVPKRFVAVWNSSIAPQLSPSTDIVTTSFRGPDTRMCLRTWMSTEAKVLEAREWDLRLYGRGRLSRTMEV
jgi:hypothetical protein